MTMDKHNNSGGEMISGEPITVAPMEIIHALDALEPNKKQKKSALFAEAYPSIIRAIAREVSQKTIIETLANKGLKLHPVRFKEMLSTEARLREERGERTCCEACGAVLQPPKSGDSVHPTSDSQHRGRPVKTTMSKELEHNSQEGKHGGAA